MWIVRLALRRPYTFVVAAMLVVILGIVTILRMPTDIFPDIDIPVISVVFNYTGMSPDDMEKRIVTHVRAHPHHHRQRHRAHREPVALRHRRGQDLLPARTRRSRTANAAGDGHRADGHPPDAAGHAAAADHPIQRVERADPPAVARAATRCPSSSCSTWRSTSLRPQLDHRSRACRFPIPTAASSARSWSISIPRSSTPTASRRATCPTPSTRRT